MPKLAILALLYRVLIFSFFDYANFWYVVLFVCIFLSILIGTFSAFRQTKWKRFFAYSSINHVGFFLLPLLLGNQESVANSIFYVCVYVMTMLNIFSVILSLRFYELRHYQIRYLESISGLAKINPVISLTFASTLFSMAGIPPLAGFFSKVFVLSSSLRINALGISLFAVVMSCIACFYYIRLVKMMYFDKQSCYSVLKSTNKCNSVILGLTLAFILSLFYDIELVFLFAVQMSLSFIN